MTDANSAEQIAQKMVKDGLTPLEVVVEDDQEAAIVMARQNYKVGTCEKLARILARLYERGRLDGAAAEPEDDLLRRRHRPVRRGRSGARAAVRGRRHAAGGSVHAGRHGPGADRGGAFRQLHSGAARKPGGSDEGAAHGRVMRSGATTESTAAAAENMR